MPSGFDALSKLLGLVQGVKSKLTGMGQRAQADMAQQGFPTPSVLDMFPGGGAAGSIGFGKLRYPPGAKGTQEILGDYYRRAYQEWPRRGDPFHDKGFESWLGDNPLDYHGHILQDVLMRNPKNPVDAVKTSGWFTVGGTPATDVERAAMVRQGMAANPSIQERQLLPEKMAELQEWIKQQLGY